MAISTHGRSGGPCDPPERSCAEHATPSSSITPTAPSQRGLVQGIHTFLTHVRNTSMIRALLHITEEEDPSLTKYRPTDDRGSGTMYDIADQGPHEFPSNIAPTHERSSSGRPLPREVLKTPPPKE
ncbi:hypothetical protein EVAR_77646_1 [Eumeta japonica]|uniref:Uncharacterized protein n=1 Tax=Eumeta variegata TaxID=151549 RepID=A0A4C1TA07_EUMVA|nr:hypothetical protein EVAR_77646_1 [Eumeta japonica]